MKKGTIQGDMRQIKTLIRDLNNVKASLCDSL